MHRGVAFEEVEIELLGKLVVVLVVVVVVVSEQDCWYC